MNYKPSSELQRQAEENDKNIKRLMKWLDRSAPHRYLNITNRMDMYKDKKVCKEYEHWLDNGRSE